MYSTGLGQTITPSGPTTFCVPGSVTLTATGGIGITGYQWINGAADIAGATGVNYNVTTTGSYKVRLSRGALSDTTIGPLNVVVNPLPSAPTFTFSTNNQCASLTFSFSVTSPVPGITYTWDFGDGTSANGASVIHVYDDNNSTGNGNHSYNVSVTAETTAGCTRQSGAQSLTVKQKPDASLGPTSLLSTYNGRRYFSKCSGAASEIFTFTNLSTTTNSSYKIIWGDGSPDFTSAAFATIVHVYNVGTNILQFIASGNGCSDTTVYYIFVGSNPAVGLGNPGNTNICTGTSLTFPISSTSTNTPGTTYLVSFNDGSQSLSYTTAPLDVTHTFNSISCGTNSGTYTNSFSATIQASNPCQTSSATVVPIYVSEKPTTGFTISPNDTVCQNSDVTFTNTSVGNTYINNGVCNTGNSIWSISPSTGWTISSGTLGNDFGDIDPTIWTSGSSALVVSFTQPGTYSIKLKAGNPNCGKDSVIKTICVNSIPNAAFSIDQTTGCAPLAVNTNNTTTANTCGNNTYSWSVIYTPINGCLPDTSNFSFTSGTNASSVAPEFLFNGPGIYTISLTATAPGGTCISLPVTQIVTVKGKPNVFINIPSYSCGIITIAPIAEINNCEGAVLGYAWAFDSGTPATASTLDPGNVTFSTVGAHPITLAVTNECGTTTANEGVVVTTTPDVTAPPNQVVCSGAEVGPFNFTSSFPTGYFWINSDPSIGLGDTGAGGYFPPFITVNNGTAPVVATIIVTPVISANCKGVPDTFTITVNPKPSVPLVTSPLTYCLNEVAPALTATTDAGNTVTWYNNPALTGGTTTAPTPVTSVQATASFYVTQTNSFTCRSDASQIDVTVNPGINGNTISANQTICAGTAPNALVSGAVSGGSGIYNYQWQSSLTGTFPWVNISGETGSSFSPPVLNDTIWYRRVVTSTPCSDTSNIIRIVVQDALSNFNIAASQTICEASAPLLLTGQLPIGGGGNYNYQWYSSTDNFTWSIISGAVSQDYQPGALSVTTYFKRELDAAQCDATSNIVTVTVNPKPIASITAIPSEICVYNAGSVSFTATIGTAPYNIVLVVTKPGGATDTIRQTINNNGPANIQVIALESAAGNYSIQLFEVTDNNGCIRTNITPSVNILVKPRPVLVLSASPASVCDGNSSTLTASGADTYDWSPAATLSAATGSPVTATPTITTAYSIRGTLNACFKDSSLTVAVIPGAVAAMPAPARYCVILRQQHWQAMLHLPMQPVHGGR